MASEITHPHWNLPKFTSPKQLILCPLMPFFSGRVGVPEVQGCIFTAIPWSTVQCLAPVPRCVPPKAQLKSVFHCSDARVVTLRAAITKPTLCHLCFAGLSLPVHICFVCPQASCVPAAWALGQEPRAASFCSKTTTSSLSCQLESKTCKMSAFPGSLPSMLRQTMTFFNFNNRQLVQ